MSRIRAAGLAVLAPITLLLLSGCSTPLSRVEVSLVAGELTFLSCEPANDVDTIRASVTQDGTGEVEEVWRLTGDGDFGPDRPIVYGEVPDGFEVKSGPEPLTIGETRIRFSIAGFAGGIRYVDTWNFLGSELREGQWLDRNGLLHDAPCS